MNLPALRSFHAAYRFALLPLLFLTAIAVPLARADDYRWEGANGNGGSGDFNTFGWYDFTTQTDHVGPPTSADNAYIVADSVVTCADASVNQFFTAPGGVLDLSGTFTAARIGSLNLIGTGTFNAKDFGSVTVAGVTDTGTTINVTGATLYAPLYYGLTAPAVNLGGGGKITLSFGGTGPGHSSPTLGTVHVYDPGSTLSAVGLRGFNGRIDTGARLQTDNLNTSPGSTLELDGPGTTWTDSDNPTISGGLRIINGATAGASYVIVNGATQPGPGGIVLVSGAGSVLHSNASIGAGANGGTGGSMTIDGGGMHQGTIGLGGGDAPATLTVINGGILSGTISSDGLVSVSGGGQVLGGLTSGFSTTGGTASFDGPGTLLTGGAELGLYAGGVGDISFTHSAMMQLGTAGSTSGGTFVTIGGAGVGTLTFDSAAALQMLGLYSTMEIGERAGSQGTLNIRAASAMSLEGPLIVGDEGEGTLNAEGPVTATGNLTVGETGMGTLNVSGAFMSGTDFTHFIDLGVEEDATGQANVSGPAATADFNSPMVLGVSGHGELNVSGGGTARALAALLGENINAVGTLDVYNSGSSLAVAHDLSVGGRRSITTLGGYGSVGVNDDGLLTVHRELFISATGALTVAPAPLPDGSTPASGGRIYVGIDTTGPDGAVRVGRGGLLSGKGTLPGTMVHVNLVTGNVVLGAGGEFRPGAEGPDVFTIQGDCDLSDGGVNGGETKFGLAGTGTPGTNYDQLLVSGQATLGGTLTLVMLPGYAPQVGDRFRIIQAGSATGAFTKFNAPGLTINTTRDATGLTVTVTGVTPTAPPAITSATMAAGSLGEPFSYRIVATNTPAGYVATGLPDGVEVDPASGRISGVPTEPGVFPVTLHATNASGTGDATLSLAIDGTVSGAPFIRDQTLPSGVVGGTYRFQIDASPARVAYAAAGLPPGLQIDASSGYITGTPTQAGAFAVFFAVTNASGTSTRTLTLTVYGSPVITSGGTASGTVGVPFRFQVTATNFPAAYSAKGLPPGLTINTLSFGQISGTPTKAGTFTLTVGARNPAGGDSATLTLTINPALPAGAPTITSAATAGGTLGVAFTYQIMATNTPTSYGAAGLPAGLLVNTDTGLISGTPTTVGIYAVTVSASNVKGTGSITLTLTVAGPPAITSAAGAAGTVGVAFSYQITATGSPMRYSVTGLPTGLKVDPISGLISGTPTVAGIYSLTLSATNSVGTGMGTLTLTVSATPADHTPTITSAATANGQVGVAFSYQITATNAPTSYGATGGPAGLTLNAKTGLLSGTPTAAGTYKLALSASNAAATGTGTLTLTVAPAAVVVPVVTVTTLGDGMAVENGEKGKASIARTGDTNSPLTVFYKVKGSAKAGVDYKELTGVVIIPAGASKAKVKIKPIDNATHDGTRKVKIKILSASDGSYLVGNPFLAKIKIIDND